MFCRPEIRRPKAETRKKAEIRRLKDFNIEHPTSNIERPMAVAAAFQVLDVGCWMFDVSFFALLRSSGFGFGMARADFRAALRRD